MRRTLWFVVLGLIVAACQQASTPLTPTSQPVMLPTPPILIVTLEPAATPVMLPAVDLGPYIGPWQIGIDYRFSGGAVLDEIRFLGGVSVEVRTDGVISGRGALTTAVRHADCMATVEGDGEIALSVSGEVRQGPNGVEIAFSLLPEDPQRLEHYRLDCRTFPVPAVFDQRTLWPAVKAIEAQPYILPMQPEVSLRMTADLTTATGRTLQGTLTTTLHLSR